MPVTMIVVPNYAAMASMTESPAGLVRRWHRLLMNETMLFAKGLTKVSARRSGNLGEKFKIKFDSAGPTHSAYQLRNSAHYAKYVFGGTQGPITGRGRPMPVGKSQITGATRRLTKSQMAMGRIVIRNQVRGQRANNIPMRSIDRVLARRGILRG